MGPEGGHVGGHLLQRQRLLHVLDVLELLGLLDGHDVSAELDDLHQGSVIWHSHNTVTAQSQSQISALT